MAANTAGMRTNTPGGSPATEHQRSGEEHRGVQRDARQPRQPRYGTNGLSRPPTISHTTHSGGTSAGSVSDRGCLNASFARPSP